MKRLSSLIAAATAVLALGLLASPATAAGGVHCSSGGNLATAIAAAAPGSSISVDGVCTGNFTISKDLQLNGAATLNGTLTVNPASVDLNSITVTGTTTVSGGTLKASRSALANVNSTNGTVLFNSSTVNGNIVADGGPSPFPVEGCGCLLADAVNLAKTTVSGTITLLNGATLHGHG